MSDQEGDKFEGAALDADTVWLTKQNLHFVKFSLKCDDYRRIRLCDCRDMFT